MVTNIIIVVSFALFSGTIVFYAIRKGQVSASSCECRKGISSTRSVEVNFGSDPNEKNHGLKEIIRKLSVEESIDFARKEDSSDLWIFVINYFRNQLNESQISKIMIQSDSGMVRSEIARKKFIPLKKLVEIVNSRFYYDWGLWGDILFSIQPNELDDDFIYSLNVLHPHPTDMYGETISTTCHIMRNYIKKHSDLTADQLKKVGKRFDCGCVWEEIVIHPSITEEDLLEVWDCRKNDNELQRLFVSSGKMKKTLSSNSNKLDLDYWHWFEALLNEDYYFNNGTILGLIKKFGDRQFRSKAIKRLNLDLMSREEILDICSSGKKLSVDEETQWRLWRKGIFTDNEWAGFLLEMGYVNHKIAEKIVLSNISEENLMLLWEKEILIDREDEHIEIDIIRTGKISRKNLLLLRDSLLKGGRNKWFTDKVNKLVARFM